MGFGIVIGGQQTTSGRVDLMFCPLFASYNPPPPYSWVVTLSLSPYPLLAHKKCNHNTVLSWQRKIGHEMWRNRVGNIKHKILLHLKFVSFLKVQIHKHVKMFIIFIILSQLQKKLFFKTCFWGGYILLTPAIEKIILSSAIFIKI